MHLGDRSVGKPRCRPNKARSPANYIKAPMLILIIAGFTTASSIFGVLTFVILER